jgi:hypothetical protein
MPDAAGGCRCCAHDEPPVRKESEAIGSMTDLANAVIET